MTFLDTLTAHEWVNGTGGQSLWCKGVPGSGKTTTAAALVERLRATFKCDDDVKVAGVFCNYKMADAQSVSNIMAGIWLQMTAFKDLDNGAITVYAKNTEIGTRPTVDEILELLHHEVENCSKVLLIIDALDELSEACGLELLKAVKALGAKIRLMITSRLSPGRQHVTFLQGLNHYDISACGPDLEMYIDDRVNSDATLARFCDDTPGLRESIKKGIVTKAGEM